MNVLLAGLIVIHVGLALSLLVPAVLLPLILRTAPADPGSPGRIGGVLLGLQRRGPIIGMGLLLTGLALVTVLGLDVITQPWLLVAIGIYAANLVIAVFVQRPRLLRLSAAAGEPRSAEGDARWRALARRQRSVSYVMAILIGAVGFLMSTKPVLW